MTDFNSLKPLWLRRTLRERRPYGDLQSPRDVFDRSAEKAGVQAKTRSLGCPS
jgi:hypothetical protein